MTTEIIHSAVQVATGTTQAAPQVTDISFLPGVLTQVHWRVAPGALGVLHWALTAGQGWIWPKPVGTFLVASDEAGDWYPEGAPDSGFYQVTAFNTGAFPHTVRFELHVRYGQDLIVPRALLGQADLAESPDLSQAGPPLPPRGFPF